MCGLCGAFGEKMHWATRSKTDEDGAVNAHANRIIRQQRMGILNAYLKPIGLKVSDWQNINYLIETPTGRTEIAGDLFELWQKVEDILGKPFDPLAV